MLPVHFFLQVVAGLQDIPAGRCKERPRVARKKIGSNFFFFFFLILGMNLIFYVRKHI